MFYQCAIYIFLTISSTCLNCQYVLCFTFFPCVHTVSGLCFTIYTGPCSEIVNVYYFFSPMAYHYHGQYFIKILPFPPLCSQISDRVVNKYHYSHVPKLYFFRFYFPHSIKHTVLYTKSIINVLCFTLPLFLHIIMFILFYHVPMLYFVMFYHFPHVPTLSMHDGVPFQKFQCCQCFVF